MPKLTSQEFYALGALALFNFVFLGSEFRYDIEVGRLVGSSGVVAAQGVILGASVVGFEHPSSGRAWAAWPTTHARSRLPARPWPSWRWGPSR